MNFEAEAGRLGADGALHLLSAAAHCREVIPLASRPATFPWIWTFLGWNVHVYHSTRRPPAGPGAEAAAV